MHLLVLAAPNLWASHQGALRGWQGQSAAARYTCTCVDGSTDPPAWLCAYADADSSLHCSRQILTISRQHSIAANIFLNRT